MFTFRILDVSKRSINPPDCNKCSEYSAVYKGLPTIRVPVVPLVISEVVAATLTNRVNWGVEAGCERFGGLIGGGVSRCQAAEDQQQQDEPHIGLPWCCNRRGA